MAKCKSIVLDEKSTESITRYLRNKDTDITDIHIFITEKLFTDSSIYLPQKEKFILELLVDRISQTNGLSESFKVSPLTWKLLIFVWEKCNGDARLQAIRTKILSSVKFGDVFTKLLVDIYEKQLHLDFNLIQSIANFMNLIIRNFKIHLSDTQNSVLIKYLLIFAEKDLDNISYVKNLLQLVFYLFKLNNSKSSKYDTKHKLEFCHDCLGNILIFGSHYSSNNEITTNCCDIIIQILFTDIDNVNILKYIENFLKNKNHLGLKSTQIIYLLNLMIPKLTIAELEESVKLLISSYPSFSAPLLKEVTDMNKTLSNSFLSSLVEKSLSNSDNTDFDLIIYSIRRSADVSLTYSEQICQLCTTDTEKSLSLLKELFDSYIKSRDVELFIKLWSQMVEKYPDSIFQSEKFINYTSMKIITLSYFQLEKIITSEIKGFRASSNQYPICLIAVCKGFMMGVSGSIQNALNKTLITNLYKLQNLILSILDINTPYSWELKFNVLNLFELDDIKPQIAKIAKQKYANENYYYYTMLRIYEQDQTLINDKFLKHFKSYYIKKSSSDFKLKIFGRWFMLLELFFSESDIKSFVESICKLPIDLKCVLSNAYIQSQRKIITQFIHYFIKNKEHLHYIESISVYALTKKQREEIMNILCEQILDDYSKPLVQKLLTAPTFKSKIETDFTYMVSLNLPGKIIKQIFNNYIKNSVENISYADDAFSILSKIIDNIKIKKCVKYKEYFNVALILMDITEGSKFSEKRHELIKLSNKKLTCLLIENTEISRENLCVVIDFLSEVNFRTIHELNNCTDIKQTIEAIGKSNKNDEDIKKLLFKLVCSLDTAYKPEYVFALYLVIENCSIEILNKYVSKLSLRENDYANAWCSTYQSIERSNKKDFEKYVEISTLFIKNIIKPDNEENIKTISQIFIKTISSIFTKISKDMNISDKTADLLKCLKNITSTKYWILTQYSLEMLLAFMVCIASKLQSCENKSFILENYVELCQTVSSIILYQRKRLSNRHHLILTVYISLMKTLFVQSEYLEVECGNAFERLVSNLCEPNIHSISIKNNEDNTSKDAELNNALAETKAGLRKYMPVLIFNYVKLYVQYPMKVEVKKHIDESIYMMMNLLTLNELNYINNSLDNQSRVLFRTTYEDYKKFYKWNED